MHFVSERRKGESYTEGKGKGWKRANEPTNEQGEGDSTKIFSAN